MDPSIPLHKQLSSKIGVILVLFSSVIAFLCYLLYSRELDVDKFIMQIQPELRSYSELNRRAWQINADYSQLVTSTSAPDVLVLHQKIQANSLDIKNLSTIGKSELLQIDDRLEQLYLSVNGLAENSERNALLKRSVLLQLRLSLNEIDLSIKQKQPQAEKLYQQIITDKVSDRVTVSRAKAHLVLSKELTDLISTREALNNLLVTFDNLNLQTNLDEFNYQSQQIEQVLLNWMAHWQNDQQLTDADNKLLLVFSTLQGLLFEEQHTIAKWRGHIRVASEYFGEMQSIYHDINQVIGKMKAADFELQNLPGILNDIPYTSGRHSREMYYMSTLALASVFFLLGCLLAYRIYLSIKRHGESMRQVTGSFLTKEALDDSVLWNRDLNELAENIKTVEQPEHTEVEYQSLSDKFEQSAQDLYELAHIALFTSSSLPIVLNDNAKKLLFSGAPQVKDNWGKAFDKNARNVIFQCLRRALNNEKQVHCFVENVWSSPLQISLTLKANQVHGVIIDQRSMIEEFQPIRQELQVARENQVSLYQDNLMQLEEINQAISRAMVQAQNPNKSFEDICQQSYRQQAKLLEWSEQALLLAKAKQPTAANLLNANLMDLLQVCSYNTVAALKSQRLRILFEIEQDLKTNVKVAQPYFSYCIATLMNIVLKEQLAATLVVKAELLDVNPGQQRVKLSLQVMQKYNKGALPELVQLLLKPQYAQSPMLIKSLFTGLQLIHGEVESTETKDYGYEVVCQLPIAISEQKDNKQLPSVDYSNRQIFLAAPNEQLAESLSAEINANNGRVEKFFSAEHLLKALHIKALQAQPVAAVVVAPEIYKTDQDGIVQHLEGLPSAIRPKLFVLQSLFGKHISRQGVFSFPDSCFYLHEFALALDNLIQSDAINNKVIFEQSYQNYHFRKSNIQLLLVIKNVTKHSELIAQLHWLGLQVNVEVDTDMAQQLWKSGRYQLLVTDLEFDPFVDMNVGKPLYRGVFLLNEELSIKERPKHLAHWKIEHLPSINQVDSLVDVLQPWLTKLSQVAVLTDNKVKVHQPSISTNEPAEKQLAALELDPAHNEETNDKAFNLAGFAKNQGSAELAAFMLDEYLLQLEQTLSQLEETSVEQVEQAQLHIDELRIIARILTAEDFKLAVNECQQTLNDANQSAFEHATLQLRAELGLIQAYSLAI